MHAGYILDIKNLDVTKHYVGPRLPVEKKSIQKSKNNRTSNVNNSDIANILAEPGGDSLYLKFTVCNQIPEKLVCCNGLLQWSVDRSLPKSCVMSGNVPFRLCVPDKSSGIR